MLLSASQPVGMNPVFTTAHSDEHPALTIATAKRMIIHGRRRILYQTRITHTYYTFVSAKSGGSDDVATAGLGVSAKRVDLSIL